MPPTKRKAVRSGESKREGIIYHCRDCAHSYDWHSRAIDGHLILCRCPYKMDGGRYCIFLHDEQCERFKLRADADTKQQIR